MRDMSPAEIMSKVLADQEALADAVERYSAAMVRLADTAEELQIASEEAQRSPVNGISRMNAASRAFTEANAEQISASRALNALAHLLVIEAATPSVPKHIDH